MTFEEFAAARVAALLRLAVVLSGDRGVAEDVVQEVLLRVSRRWTRISALSAPDAYVSRMVVNEYASWRRKWARVIPREVIADERTVADHADRSVERDALNQQLDRLPLRQRTVLVLRYYEGLSDEAIARVLGCSTGTVRSHASRALATLRIDPAPVTSLTSHTPTRNE